MLHVHHKSVVVPLPGFSGHNLSRLSLISVMVMCMCVIVVILYVSVWVCMCLPVWTYVCMRVFVRLCVYICTTHLLRVCTICREVYQFYISVSMYVCIRVGVSRQVMMYFCIRSCDVCLSP